jgi:hypothetical protein
VRLDRPRGSYVPATTSRGTNFSPAGIACRGTGKLLLIEAAFDKLQALRDRLGKPLIIRSAYRSPKHNRAVGGAQASKHLEASPSTSPWRTTTRRRSRRRRAQSGSRGSTSIRARGSSTSISGRRGFGASTFRGARRLVLRRASAGAEPNAEGDGAAGVAFPGARGPPAWRRRSSLLLRLVRRD